MKLLKKEQTVMQKIFQMQCEICKALAHPQRLAIVDRLKTGEAAASDLIAIGLMRALSERGVTVPAEVAVVGYDDISIAGYVDPPLTTVSQDAAEASKMLVDTLVQLIEGESVESTLMTPRLVVRRSCGS